MADAYETGMALGQSAYRDAGTRRIAERRTDLDERQQKEAELTGQLDRRRLTAMSEDLEFTAKLKKDEMQRLMEAENAWLNFQKAESEIKWGEDPHAPDQYDMLLRSYTPSINKHESVAKKFDAFDKVTKQNTVMTAKRVTEAQVTSGIAEASHIAPWLNIDPPKKPDGTIDYTQFATDLKTARKEQAAEVERLRTAYGRAAAAARAKAPVKRRVYMSEVDKALLETERKSLQTVTDQITAMDTQGARQKGKPADMDKYLYLDKERQRILKRIKDLGDKYPQDQGDEEPEPTDQDTRTPMTPDGRPAEDVDDTDPLNLFGRKP